MVATLQAAAQSGAALNPARQPETAKQLPSVVVTDYYQVHGATPKELLESMRAKVGCNSQAATQWRIDWNYEEMVTAHECILRSLTVRVRVRFVLPQWVDLQRGATALQQEWKRYLAALGRHESGHAGIGIAAAKELVGLVNTRTWRAPDRKELKAQVDAACAKTLEEFRARDIAYDKKTDHGRTQGAVLRIVP